MKYSSLLTSISDIQNSLNNRPLTYKGSEEDTQVLTPNCFLYPNKGPSSLILYREEDEGSEIWNLEKGDVKAALIKFIENRDVAPYKFREFWMKEYLLDLRSRYNNLYQTSSSIPPYVKVGSVVLFKTPVQTRPHWSFATITELNYGADGLVRSVKIRKSDGSTAVSSIKNLIPMELEDMYLNKEAEEERMEKDEHEELIDSDSMESKVEEETNVVNSNSNSRPSRRAKTDFQSKLKG